jgi:hypothetical protein
MRLRLNFVVQHLLGLKEALIGCFVAMSFSHWLWVTRAMVAPLGRYCRMTPLGVLVSSALPAVMRGGEVELDRSDCFHLAIPVELGPVVRRDGAHPPRMTRNATTGSLRVRRLVKL